MLDYNAIAARFLALLPPQYEKGRARVERTLQMLFAAHASGSSIHNPDYQDAKRCLSDAVHWAQEYNISEPYTAGRGGDNPETHVTWALKTYSLHDYIGKAKKLHKVLAEHRPSPEFQRDLIALYDAMLPVAQIVAELKDKVVKGRKPNPEAAARRMAVESRKVVRTCSVCLSNIGILHDVISDHGYRLPHAGMKTATCPGSGWPALEESSAGVKNVIEATIRYINAMVARRGQAPTIESITLRDYAGRPVIIDRNSPKWERAYERYVNDIDENLKAARHALGVYEKRLANWKPTPQGLYSGGKRRHAKPSTVGKLNAEVRRMMRK